MSAPRSPKAVAELEAVRQLETRPGLRLAELLAERGQTVAEFGVTLGMTSPANLYRHTRGERPVGREVLSRWAVALGVDVGFFYSEGS